MNEMESDREEIEIESRNDSRGEGRVCASCGTSLEGCDYRRQYCMACAVERQRLAKKMSLKKTKAAVVKKPRGKRKAGPSSHNSAIRQIVDGWRKAFGRSWYDDHPGQKPTLDVDIMSEESMRQWRSVHGSKKPPKCSAARWRSFLARCADPERYEIAEEP